MSSGRETNPTQRILQVCSHLSSNGTATTAPETGGVGHGDAVIKTVEEQIHPLEELHTKGQIPSIPKVGSAANFDPDYIGGLRTMIAQADPNTWLSFYDNFNEDVSASYNSVILYPNSRAQFFFMTNSR